MVEIPLPIRFLEPYIKDWKESLDGIIVYPKSGECDKLILKPHFAFLTGEPLGWEFLAIVNIVPMKKMNEELAKLYKYLKRSECEIKWKGFIRKKPTFETINKNLDPNPELSLILNRNEDLMRTLKAADLKELKVTLFPDTQTPREYSEENINDSKSYNESQEISWVIMTIKFFTVPIERLNRIKCRRDFISIFKILSEISKNVKRFTRDKLKHACLR